MVHLEVAAWFVQDTLKGEKVFCLSVGIPLPCSSSSLKRQILSGNF